MDKGEKEMIVKVYTIWHDTIEFEVDSVSKAREHAKRIITEGLWHIESDAEIFVPVHNLVKVKIVPKEGDPLTSKDATWEELGRGFIEVPPDLLEEAE